MHYLINKAVTVLCSCESFSSVIKFLVAIFMKVLYYDRIDEWEGIDVNKTNWSKECMICHYWYFLDSGYVYDSEVCKGWHDISMIVFGLEKLQYWA